MAAVVQVEVSALVPPPRLRVPLLVFAVLIETSMFSIDVAVRAQLVKAFRKLVEAVESNIFAGKLVRLEQPLQASRSPSWLLGAPTAEEKSRDGKAVKPVQPCQARKKF